MKYKDYYAALGVERDASEDAIKKAYRKLARKFHPDVSKDPQGEAKFKDLAEAYQTLKDKDKRAAYDRLGSHQPGEDFSPSRDWAQEFNAQFNDGNASPDGIDLADLFASFARHGGRGGGDGGDGRGNRATMPLRGEDFEVVSKISLDDAFNGTRVTLSLAVPTIGADGRTHRETRSIEARIAKGASNGQRLRLRGQGGKGRNGGADGDLYLNITLQPHPIYRVDGHDLYVDLPLTPWEAALGASVEVPTMAGAVNLKVAPGAISGQHLRLAGRGLPKPGDALSNGDQFAIVKIVVPTVLSARERTLFESLATESTFNPRIPAAKEPSHAT